MSRIIGLDIGSGFTKCFDGKQKIIFPSVYSYRQPNLWEENSEIIEGIGESALEISQHPNAVTLYPVIDGIPQHSAYTKLAEEALRRLKIHFFEDICLVTGLPYEIGKAEKERIKELLKDELSLNEISAYPQSIGTLFDIELKSATVINIGHGTTEILIVENLNSLFGMSEPLASDYILTALSNHIHSKYGFKPSTNNIVDLVSGKIDEITTFDKTTVHKKEIENQLRDSVKHLSDKICYNIRYLLSQLPPNLKCSKKIVLSGGGSLISGMCKAIEQGLNCKVTQPSDPIFSNVYGFYKMGKKLYG